MTLTLKDKLLQELQWEMTREGVFADTIIKSDHVVTPLTGSVNRPKREDGSS